MRPIEGTFTDLSRVRLRTGQVIIDIHQDSRQGMEYFWLGWLSGSLYVSRDHGATWAPSDLEFRTA